MSLKSAAGKPLKAQPPKNNTPGRLLRALTSKCLSKLYEELRTSCCPVKNCQSYIGINVYAPNTWKREAAV